MKSGVVMFMVLAHIALVFVGPAISDYIRKEDVPGEWVKALFRDLKVVPDMILEPAKDYMEVVFPSGAEARLGNELTPTEVKDMPMVSFFHYPDSYYTLIMTDPDVPSRENPTMGEFMHWVVVNIKGENVAAGETIAEYVGAGPPKDSGLHRYVFLLYKQKGIQEFDEPRLKNTSAANRTNFSVSDFIAKHGYGQACAGNVFLAQYDDYVPILNEQLGM